MCTYRYTWRTSIHTWMSSPGHWARRGRCAPATHVGNFSAFSRISSSDRFYSYPNSYCVRANEFGWFSQYSMHHSAPRPVSEAHEKWVAKGAKSYQSFWPGYSWLMRPDIPTSYVEMASLQAIVQKIKNILSRIAFECVLSMFGSCSTAFAYHAFEPWRIPQKSSLLWNVLSISLFNIPFKHKRFALCLAGTYLAIYSWCSEDQEERSHCHHRTSPKYSVWQFGAFAYRTIPYHITTECNIPFHNIMLY